MTEFRHYHCEASGKTPLQLMQQYPVKQVRNKRPYENFASLPGVRQARSYRARQVGRPQPQLMPRQRISLALPDNNQPQRRPAMADNFLQFSEMLPNLTAEEGLWL